MPFFTDKGTEAQRQFINNVAACLDAGDVEIFTALIMRAKASGQLDLSTRSALRSETEIRADVWDAAMKIANTCLQEHDHTVDHEDPDDDQVNPASCVYLALEAAKDGR